MWNRNCYRFPNFFIVAFTLALLCNIYLLILLWTDTSIKVIETVAESIPSSKHQIHDIKHLNLDFIQSRLTSHKKTSKFRNSKHIKNLVKKIKKELLPKGDSYQNVLKRVAQVGVKTLFINLNHL